MSRAGEQGRAPGDVGHQGSITPCRLWGRPERCWQLFSVHSGGCRVGDVRYPGQSCGLGTLCPPVPPQSRVLEHGAGVSAPRTKCQTMQMRLRERLIEGPCPASELQSNMQMAPEEASEGY